MGETKTDTGRNDPCHCGSGKKYKNCHLDKDEAAARVARAKAAEAAPAAPAADAEASGSSSGAVPPRPKVPGAAAQPWKRSTANTRGFQRMSAPRKVGGGG